MKEVKSMFVSKTFWGAVVAIAAGVFGLFGYTLTPEGQAWLVESVASAGAIAGGLVAVAAGVLGLFGLGGMRS